MNRVERDVALDTVYSQASRSKRGEVLSARREDHFVAGASELRTVIAADRTGAEDQGAHTSGAGRRRLVDRSVLFVVVDRRGGAQRLGGAAHRFEDRFGLLDASFSLPHDFVDPGEPLLELMNRGGHPTREDGDADEEQTLPEITVQEAPPGGERRARRQHRRDHDEHVRDDVGGKELRQSHDHIIRPAWGISQRRTQSLLSSLSGDSPGAIVMKSVESPRWTRSRRGFASRRSPTAFSNAFGEVIGLRSTSRITSPARISAPSAGLPGSTLVTTTPLAPPFSPSRSAISGVIASTWRPSRAGWFAGDSAKAISLSFSSRISTVTVLSRPPGGICGSGRGPPGVPAPRRGRSRLEPIGFPW